MSDREIKLEGNAGAIIPQTVEEFEAFLKIFKVQHPDKYAIQMASGEFERFKSKLVGYKPKEVQAEAPKEVPKLKS